VRKKPGAPMRKRLRLGDGYAGRAALEQRRICIPNLVETGDYYIDSPANQGMDALVYYVVPLIAKGKVNGVLEIFRRSKDKAEAEWLDFLDTLAGQSSIAIDNSRLFTGLQLSHSDLLRAYDTTIEGWSRALDLRDKETEGHSLRVTEMTVRLAGLAGLSDEELVHVRYGALLHDIGKMGVPNAVLLKPGKLTEEEWEIMKKHTTYAFELLSPITYLRRALDIPYRHHEKWDGSGYPRGLKGEQLPLVARLFAVVDVWDALSSDRPYRHAWSRENIEAYIREQSGKHFDPKAVDILLNMLNETA
jgi:putative nucleotidyltransferase with HDIG domain